MDTREFKNHPLWEVMNECVSLSEELPSASDNLSDRVAALARYMRRFRGTSECALFSTRMLNDVRSQWSDLEGYLGYVKDGSDYRGEASNTIDALVSRLATWPQPWINSALTKGQQAALQSLQETIETERARHTAVVDELQEKLQELQDERDSLSSELKTLTDSVKDEEERLASLGDSFSSSFATSQTERSAEFDEWLKGCDGEFQASLDDNRASLAEYNGEAEVILKEIRHLQEGAEKVSGKAAAAFMARDYGSYSNRQFWSAVASFALGTVLFIVAFCILTNSVQAISPDTHATWQWVSLKLGLTLTIGAAASFLMALGNRFYRDSTNSKRVELELRAIGPFLADVDEEAARETKVKFADRMFGHAWSENQIETDRDAVSVGLLSKLVDLVPKITGVASHQ